MEKDPLYLHRRGPAYYYRRPILKEHIGLWLGPTGKPRREWSISLRTNDRRTAIDRMAKAEARYTAELARNLDEASKRTELRLAKSPLPVIPLAQDDPDYLDLSSRWDLEEAGRAEWEAENDPLWGEREALREQAATLRDAKSNRELGAELRAEERATRAVAFMRLFDDWAAFNGKPDTIAAYRSYAVAFDAYVDKADANDITENDVSDWRNVLRQEGGLSGRTLSARTINGAYMCAINAIFEHACRETRRVKTNPARELRALRGKAAPALREKSITDNEALDILADAMLPGGDRLSPKRRQAKRWCQWLMAYSGARVLEIAQLRKEDVGVSSGIAYIFITPEAGKNKTETARKVPLHPHILQQGFLEFVEEQPAGPLFYDPELGRGGRLASQAKKVGQYLCERVRAVGATVAQPNHGWRHRMETMNNRYDLRDKNFRMILGHKAKDSNGTYGDHELPAMLREIRKLPAYQGQSLPSFTPEPE